MDDSLDTAYRHCRDLTKQEAKNFYYGFFLLPEQKQRAIYAVYAFARQCDDIVDNESPQSEKTESLASFRQTLDRCLEGSPEGPLFVALRHTVDTYRIPHQYLHQLIDGVEMDIAVHRYDNFDELRRYCYLVASTVGLICIEIFGYDGSPSARDHAIDLGITLQLTNILRDIREDAERGRVYIPQDELAAFGYSEDELLRGVTNDSYQRLLAYQVQRARDYYQRGRQLLAYLPRRPRACVGVMAGIYSRILDDIEQRPQEVLRARIGLSTGYKLALAGRELMRSLVL